MKLNCPGPFALSIKIIKSSIKKLDLDKAPSVL